jgi:hypothetical protein
MTERGHPVRLSAQREQPFKAIPFVSLERPSLAGGQDVHAPLLLAADLIWTGHDQARRCIRPKSVFSDSICAKFSTDIAKPNL